MAIEKYFNPLVYLDMKHLAVIRFWYEGNAFSTIPATKETFMAREWICGPAAKEFYQGTNIEVAAVEELVELNPQIEAHYIFCTAAYPAGPMENGLFNEILTQIETGLKAHEWQGVYLSLHGSAVTQDELQPETHLLQRVRELVGTSVPIAVTFDLHANLNPEIGQLANIVCGYKTYPHIDMRETAAKALGLLGKTINGDLNPITTIIPAGFAPTSFNMRTSDGPMASMMALAKQLEADKSFYDVSVFGGFVYADSANTGASISICSDQKNDHQANYLAQQFRARAPQFEVKLPSAEKTLNAIKQSLTSASLPTPVAIIEPSDNIFSGGGADTPGLLKAVLEADLPVAQLFAFFWDPSLVQEAIRAGTGNRLEVQLGSRLTREFGSPVNISVSVKKLTDGQFINLGLMEKNLPVDLGQTVVLQLNKLDIIVTSKNVPVNDPGYFDLHDIDPQDYAIVYVKAKNHFRSAFASKFQQIIEVETPGPAASDLSSFKFKNLPEQQLHTGLNIRSASIDDATDIADIHTNSWRDVYRGILTDNYLDDEIVQERLNFWHKKLATITAEETVLVIYSGTRAMGFIWTSQTGEPGYDAVIEALHISVYAKNCGYGKRLLKEAVTRLIQTGINSVCLRVFDANKPAIRFYHRLGGVKDQSGIDNFAGANAPDSRIGWQDINKLLTAVS